MKTLEIIKQYRKKRGMTQEQLGIKLKMAKQTYQSIESGVSKLNVFDFFKIIEILDIPITLFANKNLIVISEDDLSKLNKASELLQSVTSKISEASYISIGDNNNIQIGNNNINK